MTTAMRPEVAECVSCGAEFRPVKLGHIYCSRECRYRGPAPADERRASQYRQIDRELLGGPEQFTSKQLRKHWPARRDAVQAGLHMFADRPWAFWEFDAKEPAPERLGDRIVRLAELALLTPDEMAAVKEKGIEARLRIGTPAEHYGPGCWPDRRASILLDRIEGKRPNLHGSTKCDRDGCWNLVEPRVRTTCRECEWGDES